MTKTAVGADDPNDKNDWINVLFIPNEKGLEPKRMRLHPHSMVAHQLKQHDQYTNEFGDRYELLKRISDEYGY